MCPSYAHKTLALRGFCFSALLCLSACAPTVTYNRLGTAGSESSRNQDPLNTGEILYALPTTRLTIHDSASVKKETCQHDAAACWNSNTLSLTSYVSDDAVVYKLSPGGFSLLYGKTDLSAEMTDDHEPRLPHVVSVIYTNVGKNAAAAGGAAFVSLVSFGVAPAIGGALIAASFAARPGFSGQSRTDIVSAEIQFGAQLSKTVKVDQKFICTGADNDQR